MSVQINMSRGCRLTEAGVVIVIRMTRTVLIVLLKISVTWERE